MHDRYYAQRTAKAIDRMIAAGEILVDIFDLDLDLVDNLNPKGNLGSNPERMRSLLRLEGTAAILDALVDAVSTPVEEIPDDDDENDEEIQENAVGLQESDENEPNDVDYSEYYALFDISENVVSALIASGFLTPEQVNAAADDELLAVDGVGPKTLEKLRSIL